MYIQNVPGLDQHGHEQLAAKLDECVAERFKTYRVRTALFVVVRVHGENGTQTRSLVFIRDMNSSEVIGRPIRIADSQDPRIHREILELMTFVAHATDGPGFVFDSMNIEFKAKVTPVPA